jgi:hypothetical protein
VIVVRHPPFAQHTRCAIRRICSLSLPPLVLLHDLIPNFRAKLASERRKDGREREREREK